MNRLTRTGVILMLIAGVLTAVAAFVPLWVIVLDAPQYPEGLQLVIGSFAGLSGNLNSVNDLNHYVGMAQLHPEDFWEFAVLPWILIVLGALFVTAGLLRSKKLTLTGFVLLCLFGLLGFIDFFRWEYNYGHNLSPDAPIKIPGGDFQPPLIGFKQLANFEVFSWPGIGGWLLVAAGILVAIAIFIDFGFFRKLFKKGDPLRAINSTPIFLLTLLLGATLASCGTGYKPRPVQLGKEDCAACQMTLTDGQFVCEVITNKGKCFKFDDLSCLFNYLAMNDIDDEDVLAIYVGDYLHPEELIELKSATLVLGMDIHSPMGGGVAAFSDKTAALQFAEQTNSIVLDSWARLKKVQRPDDELPVEMSGEDTAHED